MIITEYPYLEKRNDIGMYFMILRMMKNKNKIKIKRNH